MMHLASMLGTGHVRQRLVAGLAAWQRSPLVAAFSQTPSRVAHQAHEEAQSILPTAPKQVGTRRRRELRTPETADTPRSLRQETATDFNVSRRLDELHNLSKYLAGKKNVDVGDTLLGSPQAELAKLHQPLSSVVSAAPKIRSLMIRRITKHTQKLVQVAQLEAQWKALDKELSSEYNQLSQRVLADLREAEQLLQSEELKAVINSSEWLKAVQECRSLVKSARKHT